MKNITRQLLHHEADTEILQRMTIEVMFTAHELIEVQIWNPVRDKIRDQIKEDLEY